MRELLRHIPSPVQARQGVFLKGPVQERRQHETLVEMISSGEFILRNKVKRGLVMGKTAVFLDLQGTLGGDGVGDISNFTFYPFAIDAIKLINSNNMFAIIVTNQSHISKGYLTIQQYEDNAEKLKLNLKQNKAYIDQIYCCPHGRNDNCTCKKPLPGLIEQAQHDFDINLNKSYLIGDMGCADMSLAKRIGCKGILVRTGVGEGSLNEFRHTWKEIDPDYIADNVLEGVKWIISNVFSPIKSSQGE